jgi:hypothetical protein
MNEQTVQLLVQIGEVAAPLVEVGVSKVLAFAKENGGNADTIAQLEANRQTIDGDAAQLEQEEKEAEAADAAAGSAGPDQP